MEYSLIQYFFIFTMVCFAGFVDSIAGGGGLITVPTYIAMGVPSELILGTNKTVSTSGGIISVYRYIRSSGLDFKILIYGIIGGVIGSSFGAHLATMLDSNKMVYILVIVVPVIFALNIYKSRLKSDHVISLSRFALLLRCFLIGLVIGCYDGFFGPGTGTFLIVAMVLFMNMEIHHASANARIINFTSNITAFAIFLIKGLIAWKIALVAIIASIIGNYIGSSFVVSGNTKVVKKVFNSVLLGLLIKSAYDIYLLS
ncbi:TSUP family transporter [Bacteriovorax sp. DB6_IX]|uniref:sulfite exporter TauE/SafE family protein n=1 Tax=Bacteriovorax sp. DB6_IX TaxID=1353530 RepID=UPI00054E57A4|nr:TSUP family transporter [Bacteriovorax sp. DB6_IX]